MATSGNETCNNMENECSDAREGENDTTPADLRTPHQTELIVLNKSDTLEDQPGIYKEIASIRGKKVSEVVSLGRMTPSHQTESENITLEEDRRKLGDKSAQVQLQALKRNKKKDPLKVKLSPITCTAHPTMPTKAPSPLTQSVKEAAFEERNLKQVKKSTDPTPWSKKRSHVSSQSESEKRTHKEKLEQDGNGTGIILSIEESIATNCAYETSKWRANITNERIPFEKQPHINPVVLIKYLSTGIWSELKRKNTYSCKGAESKCKGSDAKVSAVHLIDGDAVKLSTTSSSEMDMCIPSPMGMPIPTSKIMKSIVECKPTKGPMINPIDRTAGEKLSKSTIKNYKIPKISNSKHSRNSKPDSRKERWRPSSSGEQSNEGAKQMQSDGTHKTPIDRKKFEFDLGSELWRSHKALANKKPSKTKTKTKPKDILGDDSIKVAEDQPLNDTSSCNVVNIQQAIESINIGSLKEQPRFPTTSTLNYTEKVLGIDITLPRLEKSIKQPSTSGTSDMCFDNIFEFQKVDILGTEGTTTIPDNQNIFSVNTTETMDHLEETEHPLGKHDSEEDCDITLPDQIPCVENEAQDRHQVDIDKETEEGEITDDVDDCVYVKVESPRREITYDNDECVYVKVGTPRRESTDDDDDDDDDYVKVQAESPCREITDDEDNYFYNQGKGPPTAFSDISTRLELVSREPQRLIHKKSKKKKNKKKKHHRKSSTYYSISPLYEPKRRRTELYEAVSLSPPTPLPPPSSATPLPPPSSATPLLPPPSTAPLLPPLSTSLLPTPSSTPLFPPPSSTSLLPTPLLPPQSSTPLLPPPYSTPLLPPPYSTPSSTPLLPPPSTTPLLPHPYTTPLLPLPSTTPLLPPPSSTPLLPPTPATPQPSSTPLLQDPYSTPLLPPPPATPHPSSTPLLPHPSTTPLLPPPTPLLPPPSATSLLPALSAPAPVDKMPTGTRFVKLGSQLVPIKNKIPAMPVPTRELKPLATLPTQEDGKQAIMQRLLLESHNQLHDDVVSIFAPSSASFLDEESTQQTYDEIDELELERDQPPDEYQNPYLVDGELKEPQRRTEPSTVEDGVKSKEVAVDSQPPLPSGEPPKEALPPEPDTVEPPPWMQKRRKNALSLANPEPLMDLKTKEKNHFQMMDISTLEQELEEAWGKKNWNTAGCIFVTLVEKQHHKKDWCKRFGSHLMKGLGNFDTLLESILRTGEKSRGSATTLRNTLAWFGAMLISATSCDSRYKEGWGIVRVLHNNRIKMSDQPETLYKAADLCLKMHDRDLALAVLEGNYEVLPKVADKKERLVRIKRLDVLKDLSMYLFRKLDTDSSNPERQHQTYFQLKNILQTVLASYEHDIECIPDDIKRADLKSFVRNMMNFAQGRPHPDDALEMYKSVRTIKFDLYEATDVRQLFKYVYRCSLKNSKWLDVAGELAMDACNPKNPLQIFPPQQFADSKNPKNVVRIAVSMSQDEIHMVLHGFLETIIKNVVNNGMTVMPPEHSLTIEIVGDEQLPSSLRDPTLSRVTAQEHIRAVLRTNQLKIFDDALHYFIIDKNSLSVCLQTIYERKRELVNQKFMKLPPPVQRNPRWNTSYDPPRRGRNPYHQGITPLPCPANVQPSNRVAVANQTMVNGMLISNNLPSNETVMGNNFQQPGTSQGLTWPEQMMLLSNSSKATDRELMPSPRAIPGLHRNPTPTRIEDRGRNFVRGRTGSGRRGRGVSSYPYWK